jgi:nucleotide-binding universal stress UspA family protein
MKHDGLTLLVAVDGSPAALRAVEHALRLATEAACEIYLCNVQPAMTYVETLLAGRDKLVAHWSGSPGLASLEQPCERVEAAGLRPVVDVRHGEPAAEIAAHAREVGADLIVMGTRGLGPARGALLGSVAQRVAELAPCPVVTVR